MSQPLPVPGWYPDPHVAGTLRFWDGQGWTERVKPLVSTSPPRGSTRGHRLTELWAAAGLVSCLVLGLMSYLSFLPPVPTPLLLLPFAGLFPVFLIAIVTARADGRGVTPTARPWSAAAPSWVLVPVAFAVVGFLTARSGLPGQPETHGGLHYFNDHGALIPTDAEGYRLGLRLVQRIFTSIPAFLYTVALALLRSSRRP